jgi:hypothetical protein
MNVPDDPGVSLSGHPVQGSQALQTRDRPELDCSGTEEARCLGGKNRVNIISKLRCESVPFEHPVFLLTFKIRNGNTAKAHHVHKMICKSKLKVETTSRPKQKFTAF